MAFLTTTDQAEIDVMQAIAQRYAAYSSKRDDDLATKIANAVGKMLGGR